MKVPGCLKSSVTVVSAHLKKTLCAASAWFKETVTSFTRTVALGTTVCFLYSAVFSQALQAIVMPTAEINQRVNVALTEFNIPYSLGRITDARYLGNADRVVINIQDLHCHPEVQRNISKILGIVDDRYGLSKVYVEGGIGQVDTSWVNLVEDKKLQQKMVETLLNAGKLTGTEYYSIKTGKYGLLQGIEDEKLYISNLKRLGRIIDDRNDIQAQLPVIRQSLNALKDRYFASRNNKLDRVIGKHADRKITTEQYYKLLINFARHTDVDLYNYPETMQFLKLLDLQKHLRYQRVSKQLVKFMGTLKQKMPYSIYQKLMQKAGDQEKLDELYVALIKVAKEYRIDLTSDYRELNTFFTFIDENQKINPVELVREEKQLIAELHNRLSGSASEQEVAFLADFFGYVEAYLDNKISAVDYAYYVKNLPAFKDLWARYIETDNLPSLAKYYDLFDTYYGVNLERNNAFLTHIFASDPALQRRAAGGVHVIPECDHLCKVTESLKSAKEVIVVVTGGFHTEGLAELLKDRNISYLTITPNVTQGTTLSDKTYTEIARQQAKLFSTQAFALLLKSIQLKKQGEALNADDLAKIKQWAAAKNFSDQQIDKIIEQAAIGEDFAESYVLQWMNAPEHRGKSSAQLAAEMNKELGASASITIADRGDTRQVSFTYENVPAVQFALVQQDREWALNDRTPETAEQPGNARLLRPGTLDKVYKRYIGDLEDKAKTQTEKEEVKKLQESFETFKKDLNDPFMVGIDHWLNANFSQWMWRAVKEETAVILDAYRKDKAAKTSTELDKFVAEHGQSERIFLAQREALLNMLRLSDKQIPALIWAASIFSIGFSLVHGVFIAPDVVFSMKFWWMVSYAVLFSGMLVWPGHFIRGTADVIFDRVFTLLHFKYNMKVSPEERLLLPEKPGVTVDPALKKKAEEWRNKVLGNLNAHLDEKVVTPANRAYYDKVRKNLEHAINEIAAKMADGKITPERVKLKLAADDGVAPEVQGNVRVGTFALAANPLHWGQLVVALEAMAQYDLDKVVFILQGPGDVDKPEMDLTLKEREEMARAFLEIFGGIFEVSTVSYTTQGRGEKTAFDLSEWNAKAVKNKEKGDKLTFAYIVGSDHRHFWPLKTIKKHAEEDADGGAEFFGRDDITKYNFDELDTIGKFVYSITKNTAVLKERGHEFNVLFNDRPGAETEYDYQEINKVEEAKKVYKFESFTGQTFEASSTVIREWLSGKNVPEAMVILPKMIREYIGRRKYGHYRAVLNIVAFIKDNAKAHPDLKKAKLEDLVNRQMMLADQGLPTTYEELMRPVQAEAWKKSVLAKLDENLDKSVVTPANAAYYATVRENLEHAIDLIAARMADGKIDPEKVKLKLAEDDGVTPEVKGNVRVGTFALAGNPLHWGQIVVALEAMARYDLDKVVFILQGPGDVDKPEMDLTLKEREEMARAFLEIFGGIFEVSTVSYTTEGRGEKTAFDLSEWNAKAVKNKRNKLTFAYIVGSDHRHFWSPKVIAAHRKDADKGRKFFRQKIEKYDFDKDLDTLGKFVQSITKNKKQLKARGHEFIVLFNDRPGFTSTFEKEEKNIIENVAKKTYEFASFEGQKFEASSTAIRQWLSGKTVPEAMVILPKMVREFIGRNDYRHYRAVLNVVAFIKDNADAHPDLKKEKLEDLVNRQVQLDEQKLPTTYANLVSLRPNPAMIWKRNVLTKLNENLDKSVVTPANEAYYDKVRENLEHAIDLIAERMADGKINPDKVKLKLASNDGVTPEVKGNVRVGTFALAGNPLHWGQIVVALEAMARYDLDKVVFILQGPGDVDKPEMDLTLKEREEMAREFLKIFGGIFEVSTVSYTTEGRGEKTAFDLSEWNAKAVKDKRNKLTFAYIVGSDHRHFWPPKVIEEHRKDADNGVKFFTKGINEYDFDKDLDTLGKFVQSIRKNKQQLKARGHEFIVLFNDRPGFTSSFEKEEVNVIDKVARKTYEFASFEGQKFEASSTAIRQWLSGKTVPEAMVILPKMVREFIGRNDYRRYRAVLNVVAFIKDNAKAHPDLKKAKLEDLVNRQVQLDEQKLSTTYANLVSLKAAENEKPAVQSTQSRLFEQVISYLNKKGLNPMGITRVSNVLSGTLLRDAIIDEIHRYTRSQRPVLQAAPLISASSWDGRVPLAEAHARSVDLEELKERAERTGTDLVAVMPLGTTGTQDLQDLSAGTSRFRADDEQVPVFRKTVTTARGSLTVYYYQADGSIETSLSLLAQVAGDQYYRRGTAVSSEEQMPLPMVVLDTMDVSQTALNEFNQKLRMEVLNTPVPVFILNGSLTDAAKAVFSASFMNNEDLLNMLTAANAAFEERNLRQMPSEPQKFAVANMDQLLRDGKLNMSFVKRLGDRGVDTISFILSEDDLRTLEQPGSRAYQQLLTLVVQLKMRQFRVMPQLPATVSDAQIKTILSRMALNATDIVVQAPENADLPSFAQRVRTVAAGVSPAATVAVRHADDANLNTVVLPQVRHYVVRRVLSEKKNLLLEKTLLEVTLKTADGRVILDDRDDRSREEQETRIRTEIEEYARVAGAIGVEDSRDNKALVTIIDKIKDLGSKLRISLENVLFSRGYNEGLTMPLTGLTMDEVKNNIGQSGDKQRELGRWKTVLGRLALEQKIAAAKESGKLDSSGLAEIDNLVPELKKTYILALADLTLEPQGQTGKLPEQLASLADKAQQAIAENGGDMTPEQLQELINDMISELSTIPANTPKAKALEAMLQLIELFGDRQYKTVIQKISHEYTPVAIKAMLAAA